MAPAALPRSHIGDTVMVRPTIDETGRPHGIQVLSARHETLTRNLVAAISQWQFTAARRDGTAVATTVELPLTLLEEQTDPRRTRSGFRHRRLRGSNVS